MAPPRPNAVRPYPGRGNSCPKKIIYGIAMQRGRAATKMCHGHLGRAPSRAGRPWPSAAERCSALPMARKFLPNRHEFTVLQCRAAEPQPKCATAILAVPLHGRDARDTSPAERCSALPMARKFLPKRHEFTVLQCSAAEPQPKCATAILAVPLHGRDARGTSPAERCSALPMARKFLPKKHEFTVLQCRPPLLVCGSSLESRCRIRG